MFLTRTLHAPCVPVAVAPGAYSAPRADEAAVVTARGGVTLWRDGGAGGATPTAGRVVAAASVRGATEVRGLSVCVFVCRGREGGGAGVGAAAATDAKTDSAWGPTFSPSPPPPPFQDGRDALALLTAGGRVTLATYSAALGR